MVMLLPLEPDWSSPVEVTFGFRTDSFVSRSGKEKRRALRGEARKSLSFSVTETGQSFRSLKRTLSRHKNEDFILPDPTRSVRVDGLVGSGSTTMNVVEVPTWLRADAQVVLCDTDGSQQLLTVYSVNAGSLVVFTPATSRQWSAFSVLRPALNGTLADSISTKQHTDGTATASIQFAVAPGTETDPADDTVRVALDNREVFSYRWNWAEDVTVTHNWSVSPVDFGWGVTETNRPIHFGTREQTVSLVFTDSNIDQFEGFVKRRKGQRGEFWMPTGTSDITVTANIASGATVIQTDAPQETHPVLRGIALYLKSGQQLYFKVISTAGNSVTVDRPFPYAVKASDVVKACWMSVSRFKDDEIRSQWLNNRVAKVNLSTVSLCYSNAEEIVTSTTSVRVSRHIGSITISPPAATATGRYIPPPLVIDGATDWVMVNWGEPAIPAFNLFEHLVNSADKFLHVRD